MKFKSEYKSSMAEISPDSEAQSRIEQAVSDKIAQASAKQKKPFYVYAAAFSGAAACVALVVLVSVSAANGGSDANMTVGTEDIDTEMYQMSAAVNSAESDSMNAGLADYGADNALEVNDSSCADFAASDDSASGMRGAASVGDLCQSTDFTLIFEDNGDVVLDDGERHEYSPEDMVVHYTAFPQGLLSVNSADGERIIALDSSYLYIFEEDCLTAAVYALK